ncbi:MAG: PLD nuclease N-terminal domain-containing protein [Chloroflexota bacterium]
MNDPESANLILALTPIILLQFGLAAFALVRLYRAESDKIKYLPRWAWTLLVLFVGFIGPVAYLVIGQED